MEITLDLRMHDIGDRAVQKVRDAIPGLGTDDELIILVNTVDAHKTGGLTDELERQGFDYQPKGADGATYNIIAKRKFN